MNHTFVTQDYPPDRGGMARRHVELCRRFASDVGRIEVSTVQCEGSEDFDRGETYRIHRQPFHFRGASRFTNQIRWGRWLTRHCSQGVDVIHCGNIRPAGYAVWYAAQRCRIPYFIYVNGGDLLRERAKVDKSRLKRATASRILGDAAGVVATSRWVRDLAADAMQQAGVAHAPPIGAFDLGTDPSFFSPERTAGRLREIWSVGDAPLVITVARLVPHKGQDMGIRALAHLLGEFPSLRYVMVGEGHDEQRLRRLASELSVSDKVIFAGALTDDEVAEAYATSTLYVGASRIDNEINAEGFGISFLEAASSGLPVVAGDSGGVRSAVRDGETGLVVPATDVASIADAIASFLRDATRRAAFGAAGRRAVETHYNWDRVARDTREFTQSVAANRRRQR